MCSFIFLHFCMHTPFLWYVFFIVNVNNNSWNLSAEVVGRRYVREQTVHMVDSLVHHRRGMTDAR